MEAIQHILVVDDEDALLFSYRRLLRSATVKIDDCMTLKEAVALISSKNYDAIITDLRLSHSEGNEGLAILQYVKTHKPATPVIVMTGYGNDTMKEKVLALGAYEYFDKPVHICDIITSLRKMGIHAGVS